MAFALMISKANAIGEQLENLESEKIDSIKIHEGGKPDWDLNKKLQHLKADCRRNCKKCCARIFSFPKKSWLHKTSVSMRHDGTIENYIFKSAVGFLSGFLLIYIFFLFFVVILNFNLGVATFMCTVIGSVLTIGLAFSSTVRCVVLLILPQFFSKRGRQALIAYAFILTLTGPAKNTLNNMGIMSESLACGQEQLKIAVKQIMEAIKKPFIAIKEAIKKVVKVVKVIVKKVKEFFLTIKRIIMGIVRVIKAAFNFLGKIFNICSKKVGTPFQRCQKVFDNSVTDCYAELGPMFDWLCSIVYVTKAVCYIVKPLDFICMLLDFINDSIIGIVVRKIKTFVRHIRSTFYVRIRFSHSFDFKTTHSKSMKEVTEGIIGEIRQRCKKVLQTFDIISSATSFFFLIVILRAMHYRYKFLTVERFDNTYITKNFREIDFRRAQMDKDTVLPLNRREKNKYVDLSSMRLIKLEKKKLSKSLMFLTSITFQLGMHMAADYCLYWILATIRRHGKYNNTVQAPKMVGLHVEGKGMLAGLLKSITNAFKPLGVKMEIDTIPCLPDPIPPNYDTYIQIGFILFLCWILAIFEPYGLRLRSYVMCYYHPARARERSVWLYNHILRNRGGFLKFARRLLKRKFFGQKGDSKVTCKEYLRACIKCKVCRICLGDDKQEACVLCAEVFRPDDPEKPIRCSTPGCPGLYCQPCFNELKNICTICLEPIQYGDLSDADEERDSSEDETSSKFKRRSKLFEPSQNEISKTTSLAKMSSYDFQIRRNIGYIDLLPEISRMKTSEYSVTRYSSSSEDTSTIDYSIDASSDFQIRKNKKLDVPSTDVSKNENSDFSEFSKTHDSTNTEETSTVDHSSNVSSDFRNKRNKGFINLLETSRLRSFDNTLTTGTSSLTIHSKDTSFDLKIQRNKSNIDLLSSNTSNVQSSDYSELSKAQNSPTTKDASTSTVRSKNSSFDFEIRREPAYIDLLLENTRMLESKSTRSRGGNDSDYNSDFTDSDSTEYSTSYQYSSLKPEERPARLPFLDVERQHIPDYTSMEIFRNRNQNVQICDASRSSLDRNIKMKEDQLLHKNRHMKKIAEPATRSLKKNNLSNKMGDLKKKTFWKKKSSSRSSNTSSDSYTSSSMEKPIIQRKVSKQLMQSSNLTKRNITKWLQETFQFRTNPQVDDPEELLMEELQTKDASARKKIPMCFQNKESKFNFKSNQIGEEFEQYKGKHKIKNTKNLSKHSRYLGPKIQEHELVPLLDLKMIQSNSEDSSSSSSEIEYTFPTTNITKSELPTEKNTEQKTSRRNTDNSYDSSNSSASQNTFANSNLSNKTILDLQTDEISVPGTYLQDLTTERSSISDFKNISTKFPHTSVPNQYLQDSSTERTEMTETTRLNYLFQDLKYDEINETPRSVMNSNSSTQTACSFDNMVIRKRNKISNYASSVSLSDFSEFNRKYEEKVKKYYRQLKKKRTIEEIKESVKNNTGFFYFFKKLFQ